MGVAGSKGICAGCFGGLFSPELRPDVLPANRRYAKVSTYEEALGMERQQSGSFSPKPSPRWASPAPARKLSELSSIDDIWMEEIEVTQGAGSVSSSVQIDRDGPKRRNDSNSVQVQRSKFEVEQLLASPGSLPRPMLSDQREAIIRELMPTATHEMLARVPAKLLHATSSEAQALRRKLVAGATIVFVTAGLKGKRFVLEQAAALGVKSVVIDHPGSWSEQLVEQGVIAKFLPVDMSQSSEQIFDQTLAHVKGLGADGRTGAVDAITTFIELSVPLVARLCEALGLPGFRPEAVDNARDKHRTRACLASAGLPTPRNFLIKCESDLRAAATKVGFPAVLKPVSGAASLGVRKVESAEHLLQCYKEVVAELGSLVVSCGALIQGDGCGTNGVDAANLIDLTVLLEQFLDGCEVDIDVVMSEGEWRYAAVADNGPTLEPYFNETWAACPSLLPKEKQRELKELAVSCVKACGFSAGVFHVECKYTTTGPQLIEVNARMGGGQVRECNLMTWGVDLVEETLFIALGIPARPAVPSAPIQPVAYCYMNAKTSGTMGSIQCIQDLSSLQGVVWAKPLVCAGDKVVGPADGLPTWLCDLLVTKKSAQEALDFLHKIEQDLPVQII